MTRTAAEIMAQDPADIMLTLPRPPSANALRVPLARKGSTPRHRTMVNSSAYRDWLTLAGLRCNLQTAGDRVPEKYGIHVFLPPGLDLDNALKPVNDLLQKQGVITNDRKCTRIVVDRAPGLERDLVVIHLWAL